MNNVTLKIRKIFNCLIVCNPEGKYRHERCMKSSHLDPTLSTTEQEEPFLCRSKQKDPSCSDSYFRDLS